MCSSSTYNMISFLRAKQAEAPGRWWAENCKNRMCSRYSFI
jgi:hypothetical protein